MILFTKKKGVKHLAKIYSEKSGRIRQYDFEV
jgi:hypothetical protein